MATNNGKIKLYKNPERRRPDNLKPYVPAYQLMGVEPEEYTSPTSPAYIGKTARPAPLPKNNPRAPKTVAQPYAEVLPSPIGRGRGLLPNVGNSMEQSWSGVDGEIVDDLELDPKQEMVDNNDYVTPEALGLPPEGEEMFVEETEFDEPQASSPWPPTEDIDPEETEQIRQAMRRAEELQKSLKQAPKKNFLTADELQNALKEEYLTSVLKNLQEGDYLLLVGENAVCSGPLEDIQEQARGLVFGEHPLCGGTPMPVEDIIVLKRVEMKVGLFLE